MENQSPIRVLVIDNDRRVGADLRAILEPLGYVVGVAEGTGQELVDHANALARSFRPHVAIIDIRLVDEYSGEDRSGLGLLESLKPACRFLYSAYLTPELTLEVVKQDGTIRWVSKHQSPQRLLDEVASAARGTFNRSLEVRYPANLTPRRIAEAILGSDMPVPPDMVKDALGRLFPDNRSLTLERLGTGLVDSFSVSRGRSFVSKVYPDDIEPVVVKLAPADKTRNEERNYRDYINGRLVGQFYAQLQRTALFWDLGGAVYSFMGSSLNSLPSFAAFYRTEAEPRRILKPLEHFFKEVWSRYYGRPELDRVPLFDVYDKTLRLKKRLEGFSTQEETLAFPGLPGSVTNPVRWALRHAGDSLVRGTRRAITHGDLHGDNLFVDGNHAWAIDFERAGPGHILRDLAELEVDIVTRLVPFSRGDPARFYEFAVLLAALSDPAASLQMAAPSLPDPEMRKAVEVIGGLRTLAREVTRYQDAREYLWALLLDSLFVAMLVSEGSLQRERALLFGAALCERLRPGLST